MARLSKENVVARAARENRFTPEHRDSRPHASSPLAAEEPSTLEDVTNQSSLSFTPDAESGPRTASAMHEEYLMLEDQANEPSLLSLSKGMVETPQDYMHEDSSYPEDSLPQGDSAILEDDGNQSLFLAYSNTSPAPRTSSLLQCWQSTLTPISEADSDSELELDAHAAASMSSIANADGEEDVDAADLTDSQKVRLTTGAENTTPESQRSIAAENESPNSHTNGSMLNDDEHEDSDISHIFPGQYLRLSKPPSPIPSPKPPATSSPQNPSQTEISINLPGKYPRHSLTDPASSPPSDTESNAIDFSVYLPGKYPRISSIENATHVSAAQHHKESLISSPMPTPVSRLVQGSRLYSHHNPTHRRSVEKENNSYHASIIAAAKSTIESIQGEVKGEAESSSPVRSTAESTSSSPVPSAIKPALPNSDHIPKTNTYGNSHFTPGTTSFRFFNSAFSRARMVDIFVGIVVGMAVMYVWRECY